MMTAHDEVLAPPARREFWRWVGESVRPYLGWILLALGAIAIFLGWFGVSGQSLTAKQLPYLVSGGLAGLALIVVGAVFLATDNLHRQIARLEGVERKVDDLYALLVLEPAPSAAAPTSSASSPSPPPAATAPDLSGIVALPTGTTFHRPTCALVRGKAEAEPVGAAAVAARGLRPCPVCEPAPAATGD
jgi:hypothetical protein